MTITRFLFVLTLLTCGAASLCAQDTLLLLNGKQLPVRITDDSGAAVFFEAEKRNGKLKQYEILKGDIFSIIKGDAPESILYVQDLDRGMELEVADMRAYMVGQNDARNGHKTLPAALGGVAVGAGAVFFFEGGFLPFLTPVVYSLGMQIPVIKVRKDAITNQAATMNPYYLEGYDKTARSKKFIHSLLGSFAGVALGSVVYEVTH